MSVWHNHVNGGYDINNMKIEYSFHHCRKPYWTENLTGQGCPTVFGVEE